MGELAYSIDHPAHPDNKGKHFLESHTTFGYDYDHTHPARGGQGQPVLTEQGGNVPVDGHKHLFGLPGATLAEREAAFRALGQVEQDQRAGWNKSGVPAELLE
jgi:hypothetical protein